MAIALTELDQDLWFPHPEQALDEPEGLLAIGGDLTPNRLRLAYRHGIFPWYEDDQPLLWWSPPDRAVVFPERFKPSRSLARLLNQNTFQVTLDEHFDAVIAGCKQHRVQQGQGTWITQEMITAYSLLFEAGGRALHRLFFPRTFGRRPLWRKRGHGVLWGVHVLPRK